MGFTKYILGGIGWAVGGPIGAVVAYIVGSLMDSEGGENNGNRRSQSGDFAISLLILSASVMKADGKVLKSELDTVKRFLLQQFGEVKAKELLQSLKKILEIEYNLVDVCHQIRSSMNLAERRVLLHFLYDIADADGHISPEEQNRILFIGLNLQIPRADINSIYASYGYRSYKNTYKKTASIDHYTVLEVSNSASDEEVKKAYRSMVKKFHPDKVSNLGEAAVKEAEKRIKQINEAYESIKKERRIK